MFYIVLTGVIVTIAGIYAASFGLWQFQQKNYAGGIAVWILSAVSVVYVWIAMIKI